MLYLAPDRKAAVSVILAAACFIALLLLFSSYFFHPGIFFQGLRHARLLDTSWRSLKMPGAYLQMLKEVAESGPVLLLLAPAALAVYVGWGRSRYFGNTTPLLMSGLFLLLRLLSPHDSGSVFVLTAVVFLFVFIAGIAADLIETKASETITAIVVGLVAANAFWDLAALARIGR